MALNLRPIDTLLGGTATNPVARSGDGAAFADALQQATRQLQTATGQPVQSATVPAAGTDLARDQAQAKLAALESSLRQQLPALGLDSLDGLQITRAANGTLSVNGTAAADTFRQALEQDPALTQQVQDAAGAQAFVRAADESAAFQRAFAANPRVAVAQYGHLLSADRAQPAVTFAFGASGTDVQFG